MFSDIENLNIMLGEGRTEREEGVSSNLARRPESSNSNFLKTMKKIHT